MKKRTDFKLDARLKFLLKQHALMQEKSLANFMRDLIVNVYNQNMIEEFYEKK